ncbi:hypothetical protein [Beggiatoa leptomitoformis]|uniref:Uncharacterized protein n=1 Tax=Beggiatoa leptomitoformis TaxID=288004 RepID=A0A2N9YCA7_9GAMM|nr:hypothetical protein [Beggiatoa leptomitoformis]ALG66586.1 hypothetical protein AL038_01090 [Beggiatoa leptomitoformis]AUI68108.1 hypothetical protein BLE401_04945 [Beggiatoa leptomitoformis]
MRYYHHFFTVLLTLLFSLSMVAHAETVVEEGQATTTEATTISPSGLFSGVYIRDDFRYKDAPITYLSVHVNGSSVMIIDVNQHLHFLRNVGYITQQEYENNIQVSAEDRVFYGQHYGIHPVEPTTDNNPFKTLHYVYAPGMDPLLLSKPDDTWWVPFFRATFRALENKSTGEKKYTMGLDRDVGGIYFDYGNFTKIF